MTALTTVIASLALFPLACVGVSFLTLRSVESATRRRIVSGRMRSEVEEQRARAAA